VAVTHDPLVEEYADRVVELTDGVVVDGVPDETDADIGVFGDDGDDGDDDERRIRRSTASGDR